MDPNTPASVEENGPNHLGLRLMGRPSPLITSGVLLWSRAAYRGCGAPSCASARRASSSETWSPFRSPAKRTSRVLSGEGGRLPSSSSLVLLPPLLLAPPLLLSSLFSSPPLSTTFSCPHGRLGSSPGVGGKKHGAHADGPFEISKLLVEISIVRSA